MEKRAHKFKKIKDFFSLQTFEMLYINSISLLSFAVNFKMSLNKFCVLIYDQISFSLNIFI